MPTTKAVEISETGEKREPRVRDKVLPKGNLKIIGIAGLVKGEQYTVKQGSFVVLGRSRECNICLRDVPAAKELEARGKDTEKHFRTVSRKHVRVAYISPDRVEIEDLSANGTFLDGKRVEGSTLITNIMEKPHELKLGTTETFCLDWWRLVPKEPTVKVKKKKDDKAAEAKTEEKDDKKKKTAKQDKGGKEEKKADAGEEKEEKKA